MKMKYSYLFNADAVTLVTDPVSNRDMVVYFMSYFIKYAAYQDEIFSKYGRINLEKGCVMKWFERI
jgi:hypothetical protein